jgi:hypothetical protein
MKIGLYDSIETMPILVWRGILKTNDLNLLYKPIEEEAKPITLFMQIMKYLRSASFYLGKKFRKAFGIKSKSIDLFAVWLDVQQEFFDEFGVDIEYQIRMKKMRRYILLMAEWIETGNRKLLNKIQELEIEMRNWENEQETEFYNLVSKVENIRKVAVNLEDMTVIRWYHLMKATVEMIQEQNGD